MAMIPIFLKTDPERPCLLVGGGRVALRKLEWLVACGASVRAISPQFELDLERLARRHSRLISLHRENYSTRDLRAYQLVIAATDDNRVNQAVAADARQAGIPVNVVDQPGLCTFYVPATVHRGDLQIAIGTSGSAPTLAKRIRKELEAGYPECYQDYTKALRRVRELVAESITDPERRLGLLDHLASHKVCEKLKEKELDDMVACLERSAREWLSQFPPHER